MQGSSLGCSGLVHRYLPIFYQLLHLAEVTVVRRLVQLRVRRHDRCFPLGTSRAVMRPNFLVYFLRCWHALRRRWITDRYRRHPSCSESGEGLRNPLSCKAPPALGARGSPPPKNHTSAKHREAVAFARTVPIAAAAALSALSPNPADTQTDSAHVAYRSRNMDD